MTKEEAIEILGIDVTATTGEIRVQYRQLSKVWHPDLFADDPEAEALAIEKQLRLNEAYRFLRDQARIHRSRYTGSTVTASSGADSSTEAIRQDREEAIRRLRERRRLARDDALRRIAEQERLDREAGARISGAPAEQGSPLKTDEQYWSTYESEYGIDRSASDTDWRPLYAMAIGILIVMALGFIGLLSSDLLSNGVHGSIWD